MELSSSTHVVGEQYGVQQIHGPTTSRFITPSFQCQPSLPTVQQARQVRTLILIRISYDSFPASVTFHDCIDKNRILLGGWQSQAFTITILRYSFCMFVSIVYVCVTAYPGHWALTMFKNFEVGGSYCSAFTCTWYMPSTLVRAFECWLRSISVLLVWKSARKEKPFK